MSSKSPDLSQYGVKNSSGSRNFELCQAAVDCCRSCGGTNHEKVPPPFPSQVAHVFNKTTIQSVDILMGVPSCGQTMIRVSPIIIENTLKLPLCTYMYTVFDKSMPWGSFPLNCYRTQGGKCGEHQKLCCAPHKVSTDQVKPIVKPHKEK